MIKRIFIIVLFVGIPIMIYLMNIDNKIYYVALGDSLALGKNPYGQIAYGYADYVAIELENSNKLEFYTKKFANSDYRTTDLTNAINDNAKIEVNGQEITIKHALTKADVITVSIGMSELFYKMGINSFDSAYYTETDLKKYVDEILVDIETLLLTIKKYCKEDIILIGYYNPLWHMKKSYAGELDSVFSYANDRMKEVSKKNKLYYVDLYNIFGKNTDYFPNPLDIHPSDKGYSITSREIMAIINKYVFN